jgi:bifunctional non-homologous end joining protein LigD
MTAEPPQPHEAMPEHLPPMLASPGRLPAGGAGEWAFELKWDGVRALAYWRPGRLRLESRNLNDVSSRYPELRALGRQLGSCEAVLDGEIVAFDEQGAPSFERLQKRMHLTSESAIRRIAREAPVTYVIFDLLYLDGRLTMELPYRARRELLAQLQLRGPAWQTPAYHAGEGRDFLRATAAHGLEGVIAKRLDSRYRPGERSGGWLKIKNVNRQELVIGGWLPGKGQRAGAPGALLMGYHERHGAQRELRYAGRVGTGFDESELGRLAAELASRARGSSPFGKRGVQPPREARFVEPELVAEVEFTRWTRERILLHSSYKGLRPDKPAGEVEFEAAAPAPAAAGAYEVRRQSARHAEIEVQGRTLRLSNRDKVMYPRTGLTKGGMIDYYAAVAPVLLPHLAGRPVTFKRYPEGVEGQHFYEKRCPGHRPEWVQSAAVWSERRSERIDYCVIEDLPTLIWAANLAAIELHPSLARASDTPTDPGLSRASDTPTALVFDLDPGAPAGLRECCRVALWIKELFDAFELQTVAKSSGAKGLQVYLPLNTPVSYEQTKPFARAVAELLEKEHPRTVVSRMTKSLRPGRVLIDWSQNDPHKTTVCVYSLRARERPTISTPLTWEEVQRGARRRSEPEMSFEPSALLERVERHGDLFAPLLSLAQALPDLSRHEAPSRRVTPKARVPRAR